MGNIAYFNFPTVGVNDSRNAISVVPYDFAPFPAGASIPATFTITPTVSFTQGAPAGVCGVDGFLRLAWTSVGGGGSVTTGAEAMLGHAIDLYDKSGSALLYNRAICYASVMSNDWSKFSDFRLGIRDSAGNSVSSANMLGGFTNSTWYTLMSATLTLTGFTSSLISLGLALKGTSTAANAGSTDIRVSSLSVYLFSV